MRSLRLPLPKNYVRRDGLGYFKVKISGDADADLIRLGRIWNVVVNVEQPVVTLDGNESYDDLDEFVKFVEMFEERLIGLYQHTSFIEQPLTRALTRNPSINDAIKTLGKKKPVVIDEADGELNSFREAFKLGYAGVSHKNCKGFFKSLLNFAFCKRVGIKNNQHVFQTGEDLSNMPLVPLHQDFAALGVLDIIHCERNGHHYDFGLGHLTDLEKNSVKEHHPDLYVERKGEMFLDIRDGVVLCPSLQCNGFGSCL